MSSASSIGRKFPVMVLCSMSIIHRGRRQALNIDVHHLGSLPRLQDIYGFSFGQVSVYYRRSVFNSRVLGRDLLTEDCRWG